MRGTAHAFPPSRVSVAPLLHPSIPEQSEYGSPCRSVRWIACGDACPRGKSALATVPWAIVPLARVVAYPCAFRRFSSVDRRDAGLESLSALCARQVVCCCLFCRNTVRRPWHAPGDAVSIWLGKFWSAVQRRAGGRAEIRESRCGSDGQRLLRKRAIFRDVLFCQGENNA